MDINWECHCQQAVRRCRLDDFDRMIAGGGGGGGGWGGGGILGYLVCVVNWTSHSGKKPLGQSRHSPQGAGWSDPRSQARFYTGMMKG